MKNVLGSGEKQYCREPNRPIWPPEHLPGLTWETKKSSLSREPAAARVIVI